MAHARDTFTLTPLEDGRLLAAGGTTKGGFLTACEIYDPESDAWRATGELTEPRHGHTATRLRDGRVLVAGSWADGYSTRAEIFDPGNESWTKVAPMQNARDRHTATLLPDGRVLVAGGFSQGGALASVEIYDPVADSWSEGAALPKPTAYHSAILLDDETLLIAAGEGQMRNYATADLLDLKSGVYTSIDSLSVPHAYGQAAARLPQGDVLIIGGEPNQPGSGASALRQVERYSPATKSWIVAASLKVPRFFHTATVLEGGWVLVAGGMTRAEPNPARASTEILDPVSAQWSRGPGMAAGRARHCAQRLADGSVLVVGGHGPDGTPLASAEIFRRAMSDR